MGKKRNPETIQHTEKYFQRGRRSSYSHVIHFRWVGEGEELRHIEAGCVVCVCKVEALLLLQMQLKER